MKYEFLERLYGKPLESILEEKENTSLLHPYKAFLFETNKDALIIHSKEGLSLEELFLRQVGETADFLAELFPTLPPCALTGGYRFLLERGYLSEQHSFAYRTKNYPEVIPFGASISVGKGCCRNISDFLQALFLELDILSIPVFIKATKKTFSPLSDGKFQSFEPPNLSPFEKKVQDSKLLSYIAPSFQTNHVLIEANDYKQNFFLDATNRTLFYEVRKGVLSPIGKEEENVLFFSPFFEESLSYIPMLPETQEKWKEEYRYGYNTCKKKQDLCEEFYQEMKPLLEEESQIVQKVYQKIKR